MGWDIIDRKAPLEIEVDGVMLTLKPMAWGERASLAQRLGRVYEKVTDESADSQVDAAFDSICDVLAGTVLKKDGEVIESAEMAELLKSLKDVGQFTRIRDAIFGAYHFDERTEKN